MLVREFLASTLYLTLVLLAALVAVHVERSPPAALWSLLLLAALLAVAGFLVARLGGRSWVFRSRRVGQPSSSRWRSSC